MSGVHLLLAGMFGVITSGVVYLISPSSTLAVGVLSLLSLLCLITGFYKIVEGDEL